MRTVFERDSWGRPMALSGILTAAILVLPMLAFAFIIAYTLIAPAAHLMLVAGRAVSGAKPDLDVWLIGRVLPLLLLLAALVPAAYVARGWSPGDQFAFGQFAIMFVAISALMIPIAIPLVKAYQQGASDAGVYVFAVLAFLAMPVAAALTTGAIFEITAQAAQQSSETQAAFANLPTVFQLQSPLSPCTLAITDTISNSVAADRPTENLPSLFDTRIYFFWIDMTIKAAFLDFFEAFDCGTTNLRHNPANPMMSAFVFLYRAFVQVFVLVVIALPFTGKRAHA